uniref:C-type lectin domain-containing protein n=1 Tax=Cyprinodon variegatus TaxID=28743 RepID=A0A3Q2D8S8_CYPVA
MGKFTLCIYSIHLGSIGSPGSSLGLRVLLRDPEWQSKGGCAICNNTSLKFNLTHVSWIEALQICRSLKSELVQMKNQTVWDELKSLLEDKTELGSGVWVGLERSIFGTNLKWKWISGTNLLETFTPKDRLNNHCGKIVRESEELKLLDANCHEELPFICQGEMRF